LISPMVAVYKLASMPTGPPGIKKRGGTMLPSGS